MLMCMALASLVLPSSRGSLPYFISSSAPPHALANALTFDHHFQHRKIILEHGSSLQDLHCHPSARNVTQRNMSFNALPTELQLQVFSYLRGHDLKAARAVSRKLRDSASPALFYSIVTGARCRLLQSLQFIAARPILQKYVNEIVFDGSSYDGTLAKFQSPYERKHIELYGQSTFWGTRTRYARSQ